MTEEISGQRVAELARAARGRVPLDAARLLGRESAAMVAAVLGELPPKFARGINEHLPRELQTADPLTTTTELQIPGTVADMMDPVHAVLPELATVADAIAFLRGAENPQQITYLYVTDTARKLTGMVVIRDLLLSEPDVTLTRIMLPDPFAFTADMPAGEAIKAAVRRHYPVYPVTDHEDRIVGVVRGWRLFERQAIEITAQSGQMVGVNKEERVDTSLLDAFRKRHPWLQVNLLTAFLAGFVVSMFEGTISQIVALAAFLPILAGQSGNTGCQALAITLRGLTLGDLDNHPVRKLILKEVTLGMMNGLATGFVAGLAMWWTAARDDNPQALLLGAVIWVAMTGSCMASGLFGVLVPITLRRFGADPATASSIFLTTGTDIAGMGLMLTLATVFVL
ncbi:MAG TPA: magnesium transporter [Candidatus Binatia bacterium]|nr:magnesium transporter [Candidatus Binatia bacterium]